MDSPFVEGISYSDEAIADISPPPELSRLDTPKPPKIKSRPFLSKILNMGNLNSESKTGFPSPDRMDADDPKVTFQLEVEAIPVTNLHYSESEEYDGAESSEMEEDQEREEEDIFCLEEEEEEEDNVSVKSTEYAGDDSADEDVPITLQPPSTTGTIASLIKSFVFVDVGPNISDTVHEFTHLLSDVANRSKRGSICSESEKD